MDEYVRRMRKLLEGDAAPRALLMGGAAILTIVVLSDLAGARDRAPELRETLRAVQAERAGAATVPSVYSVPRDLASEVMLASRAQQIPDAIVVAEDLSEDAPLEETAAADISAETVADIAEATEAGVEELAEAELNEEIIEDLAEAAPAEDVVEEVVEDLAEAPAAAEAAEVMAEAEIAEAVAEETAEAGTGDMAAGAAEPGDLDLLASANVENGQRIWRQCGACHVYDAEQNRGGPHLVNIIGREIGSAEGWRYSRALTEHGGVWTVEGLLAWVENPDTYIPGNQMAFRGLRNEQDRIDVLGFLNANRAD